MALIISAHDVALPPFDSKPVAALVERANETKAVSDIKTLIDVTEREITERRLANVGLIRAVLNRLTLAEIEGWPVDVDDTVRAVEQRLAADRAQIRDAKAKTRTAIATAVSKRIPGAHTLGGHTVKLYEAVDECANEVEDFLHELKAIQRRMKAKRKSPSLITRAELAYQHAFKKVLRVDDPKAVCEESDGDIILRLTAKVPSELFDDPDRLIEAERAVHEEVAKEDEVLVGRIALAYERAA